MGRDSMIWDAFGDKVPFDPKGPEPEAWLCSFVCQSEQDGRVRFGVFYVLATPGSEVKTMIPVLRHCIIGQDNAHVVLVRATIGEAFESRPGETTPTALLGVAGNPMAIVLFEDNYELTIVEPRSGSVTRLVDTGTRLDNDFIVEERLN